LRRDSQYINVNGFLRFEEPVMSQLTQFAMKLSPLNPWRQPYHPIAIAMEHQLLICGE